MKNEWKVSKITIHRNAHTKCRFGDDWYTTYVEMVMFPDDEIPDYRDIDKHFAEYIDGKHMTIEDVMQSAAEFIMETYKPFKLITRAVVNDSNHPDVEVERVDERNVD